LELKGKSRADYTSAPLDRADEKLSQAALFFVPDCSTMLRAGRKIAACGMLIDEGVAVSNLTSNPKSAFRIPQS
jgi:hypothetical protein